MINDFRKQVKAKLDTIEGLSNGKPLPDNMIVEGKYYFGYMVNITTLRDNLDYSNKQQTISITGYLATKGGTLEKIDNFADEIVSKLAELRFRCTINDMSTLDTTRRYLISGNVSYNTLDNQLR